MFGFLLAEIIIRILPPKITGLYKSVTYIPDKDTGFKRPSMIQTINESQCFSVKVSTNSKGFRDIEWDESQKGGVAILGDSFMEAIQVNDNQTTASIVRDVLGIKVINTGISSYGTISQIETYKKYIKHQEPDIVSLFFYKNDINDNDCKNNIGSNNTVTKSCANLNENNELLINKNFYRAYGSSDLKLFIKKYCQTCILVKKGFNILKISNQINNIEPINNQENTDFKKDKSWLITENALNILKNIIENDKSKFLIILIPSDKNTDEQIEKMFIDLNIKYIKLEEIFNKYTQLHNLSDPKYSYSCDGHWNPLGHYLSANVLAEFIIKETNLISNQYKDEKIKIINENLSKNPKEILGENNYNIIYKNTSQYNNNTIKL